MRLLIIQKRDDRLIDAHTILRLSLVLRKKEGLRIRCTSTKTVFAKEILPPIRNQASGTLLFELRPRITSGLEHKHFLTVPNAQKLIARLLLMKETAWKRLRPSVRARPWVETLGGDPGVVHVRIHQHKP